jgi:hypothetical protein
MPGDRIEGKIWISRESPNVLKYYAGQTEYWTSSASTYRASTAIKKGTVVAIAGASDSNKIVPAVWPRDAYRLAGIALNSAAFGQDIRVAAYGYMELSEAEIENSFLTQSDYMATAATTGYYSNFGTTADGGGGNGWDDTNPSRKGSGAPVYLFIGRHLKTGSTNYSWVDPTSYPGKLTLATPSGYKPTGVEVPWNDDKFNVAYKGLPQIGSVVSYTYDTTTLKLTSMVIHINFTPIIQAIQFEYPAKGVAPYQTPDVATAVTKELYHGLFPNASGANAGMVPQVEMHGWGCTAATQDGGVYTFDSTSGDNSFGLHPGYDSFLAGNNRRSDFEIESDSAFYYKIVGTVQYSH